MSKYTEISSSHTDTINTKIMKTNIKPFIPITKIMERVEKNRDTDYALFHELLYVGEFIIKITVAGFVSLIEDDRDNHRYSCLYHLVRTTSLKRWIDTLEETCKGPTAQHLLSIAEDHRRIFFETVDKNDWRYKVVYNLHEILINIDSNQKQIMNRKTNLFAWFKKFVNLRNKTRGHGALTPEACARLVQNLEESINLLIDNNPLFKQPWAYLHRNLSGKYKVIDIGGDVARFNILKRSTAISGANYEDGIYLWAGEPRIVSLFYSDLNTIDFFVPNGGFNDKKEIYELHSPITDNRRNQNASNYISPPSGRPASETDGSDELDIVGNVYTNLPTMPKDYVRRPILEKEVKNKFINDRHPVITLFGRGGIGKTSLALTVLHEITDMDRYDMIIWFSARDIDLTATGPKVVKPQAITKKNIWEEYNRLINDIIDSSENIDKNTIEKHMQKSSFGSTLFVFDNFETVRNPLDLYEWIDTHIRLPNKAVITTRFRDFRADFPIEVSGMENDEAKELIQRTISHLGISSYINNKKIDDIIDDSSGHPYVIKILLGEIASNKGRSTKIDNILPYRSDILDALFERTYKNLSPMASRIFLTLSKWRSLVPQLAVETLMVDWDEFENMQPDKVIDELVRMSLIERTQAEDGTDFLSVPIAATLFATKKLNVREDSVLIDQDVEFLYDFGPTNTVGLKRGIYPRIQSIFRKTANRISDGSVSIQDMQAKLEFISRQYPQAWFLFADLKQEITDDPDGEAQCLLSFIEENPHNDQAYDAWMRLSNIYYKTENVVARCNAFLHATNIKKPDMNDVSNMANYVNANINSMTPNERSIFLQKIIYLMQRFYSDLSATDLSRLAWLYIHYRDTDNAHLCANEGLQRDPDNIHCRSIVSKNYK